MKATGTKVQYLTSFDDINRHREIKRISSPKVRAAIFNKCLVPIAHWLGLDVFGTPVKKGDLVYWPIWDSVPK